MDAGDGIDYSDWFLSDNVYDSIGEAVQAAKQIALTLNFHLIKGSNKSNDSEKECRVYLYCSRGPARKSEGSTPPKRTTKSKKCNCPFRLAVRSKVVDCEWKYFIDGVGDIKNPDRAKGYHNHPLIHFIEVSTESNPLSDEAKQDIRDMVAVHTQPNKIRYSLNKKFNTRHNMNQIYNESYKIRKEKLDGLDPMEWTLRQATGLGYFVQYLKDDDDSLVHLFLSHPECVQMVSSWYFVIIIDSTYNTNCFRKPVIQLVGVTPVRKNFSIGFALVDNEKTESYVWVLKCLELMLGRRQPTAFVTDKEQGLAAALRIIFPQTPHLLCIWHMKRNIEAKIKYITSNAEMAEAFVHGRWNNVLYALTDAEFFTEWEDMVLSDWANIGGLMEYLGSEWLPYKTQWAHCNTNEVFHIVCTSTNRVESQHSSLKTWYNSSNQGLDTLFEGYHASIEGQVIEVQRAIDESRSKVSYC